MYIHKDITFPLFSRNSPLVVHPIGILLSSWTSLLWKDKHEIQNKTLIDHNQTMESTNLTYVSRCWPLLYWFRFIIDDIYTFDSNNQATKQQTCHRKVMLFEINN